MILSRLTLRNFCLYAGEHEFDLEPVGRNGQTAPIVIFGGVNGAGKTTILDAVQLVLFGKRAQCSKRFEKPYDEFLRDSIHQGVSPLEGASVGLTFRYTSRGLQDVFEVVRSWKPTRATVRETVCVLKNGIPDDWVSGNWNQVVEELIPNGIAQLCFFDAEKIRFLADDETSSQSLGDAIKALLGLDLAERLVADTEVLRARLAKRSPDPRVGADLERMEAELEEVTREIDRHVQQLGALENPRMAAHERLRKAEDRFARTGGNHWDNRKSLRQEQSTLEHTRHELLAQLVQLSSGELPLTLAGDLLIRVRTQVRDERNTASNSALLSLLDERDRILVEYVRSVGGKAGQLASDIDRFLSEDRKTRVANNGTVPRLWLSEQVRDNVDRLCNRGLTQVREDTERILKALEATERKSAEIQKNLNSIPEEDAIRELATELKHAAAELATCEQDIRRTQKLLDPLRTRRDELETRLSRACEKAVNAGIQSEEDRRISQLVDRTQSAMNEYLRIATTRKIDRLSDRITESFRFLIRKESFVNRVMIDPTTFNIMLYDDQGVAIPKQRLSEGEKQLFAISVLWGLSRCSARPLPTIVDSPMGRLDAKHRDQLVERYFPHASHQVLVLSTDTELERRYFESLQNVIARAYHLRYDDAEKHTVVEEGYFWECEHKEAIA